MLSYGGIPLQIPGAEEGAWINAQIPIESAFSFPLPRWLGDVDLRGCFDWLLCRPMRINCLFMPWGASRFGYIFVLADERMHDAITALNASGNALPFKMDDSLGSELVTPMHMLPPVPLSKIAVEPSLPLYLMPLVDERWRWWEAAASIDVEEGVTTWEGLYDAIGSAVGTTFTVDPISVDYLNPGVGLAAQYQHLPLLLDWIASSVGQRIVRRLDGTFAALNPATAQSLMIAQANANRKYAGGSVDLGVVNA